MYYTLSEKWHYNHTTEFRIKLHIKLDEMRDQGKYVYNKINNDRSVYDNDGNPTKIFLSEDAVNEYINWLKIEHADFETFIKKFETEEELNIFLNSIIDINFKPTQVGPSLEEELSYRAKHDSD